MVSKGFAEASKNQDSKSDGLNSHTKIKIIYIKFTHCKGSEKKNWLMKARYREWESVCFIGVGVGEINGGGEIKGLTKI